MKISRRTETNIFLMRQTLEQRFPPQLTRFIGGLVAKRSPKRVLDPSATTSAGFLAIELNSIIKPLQFDAIINESDPSASGGQICLPPPPEAKGFNYCKPEYFTTLEANDDKYDAIVSCPPFGGRLKERVSFDLDGKNKILSEPGHLLIYRACKLLAKDSIGVFVVTKTYFDQVAPLIVKSGFQTTAAIELPPGWFGTSITAHLIVVEQSKNASGLFTGRLSPDHKHQDTLLENFRNRVEGRTPDLGRILAENHRFRGFTAIEKSEQLIRAAERFQLSPFPFSEVVRKVNRNRWKDEESVGFVEDPNAVYLPRFRVSKLPNRATTCLDDLSGEAKNYLQLIINPEMTSAEFLAGFLNSTFGRLWQESLRSGNTIPSIIPKHMEDSMIYLPQTVSRDAQNEVLECQNRLDRLRMEVRELETRLWERPVSIGKIKKDLKLINQEDRYEDWLETLPFPLASILWCCHAQTGSFEEKIKQKVHFFEGLSQFLSIVHLSAFQSNENVWNDVREPLKKCLERNKVTFERSSFGTWSNVVGFFAKKGRKFLEEKKEDLVFDLFKTRNREFLERLLSKRLVSIIQGVNTRRNDWLGHTGHVTDSVAASRDESLGKDIQTVREIFGLLWEEYQLLEPGYCKHVDGVFQYQAKKVMGTRTPFQTETVTVSEAMSDGHLYLKGANEMRGLKLLPLVKILASPATEENACYFYNRLDKDGGIKFLSYHSGSEGEVIDKFSDVSGALLQMGATVD